MSDISGGETFADVSPDNAVTAARLNNHVNGATILPAFISNKVAATPVTGDFAIFYDISVGNIAKATWASIIAATVPTDPSGALPGARTLGTGAQQAAAGNDTRFPASVTGIRKGAGAGSADTAAKGPNFAFTPRASTLVTGAVSLDCSVDNRFTVPIIANATITLATITDGDTVIVETVQDATGSRTITFLTTQALTWEGSTPPTDTDTANAVSHWYFERFGANIRAYQRDNFG